MPGGLRWALPGGAQACFTDRLAGDLAGSGDPVAARRRAVVDLDWTVLRQVHGARVVVVDEPGAGSGEEADAAVTARAGAALAILTADCAPVAFASAEGVIGVAHGGWRGLAAGVMEATAEAMRALGARDIDAVLGPCIHPCCYEFGAADLDSVADRYGDGVRARDAERRPALDVPATVAAALAAAGVDLVGEVATCTGCFDRYFSYRVRRDPGRQATVVWR
jgi:polyphenol oxidase